MCGIIGAMTFGGKLPVTEKVRREATIFIITELLQLTQTRGKDATGISTLFDDGSYIGLKMGIPSIEFISRFGEKETDYNGFLKLWREEERNFKIFLGHCRKSSVGNSWDNVNNHPIKVGDIVGVHNGTLTNYEKIFDNLDCKRDGEVDSEAIFRLLHHYSDEGKNPFSEEMIHEVATRLQGSHAVMTYNGNNPYQMAAFRDAKPIEMALIKPLNMVFIASETKFLKQAVFRLNKQIHIYNTFPEELHLSDANVEYKMMIDDSMSIFDLTREITEETKIEDLFDGKKILAADKIWKKETTTTTTTSTKTTSTKTTGSTHNAWNSKTKKTGTEVNADSKDDKKVIGAVWNKSMRTYKPVEADVKKAKEMTCVDIDVDKETNTEVELPEDSTATGGKTETKDNTVIRPEEFKPGFNLTAADSAEKLVCGTPATVVEIRSGTQKAISTVKSKSITKKPEIHSEENSVVVDLSVDPEALEKAETVVAKRKRFNSDEELIIGLELENSGVLKKLPLHALANRVQRFAQKLGYYQGYRQGKDDSTKDEESIEAVRKFKLISLEIADMLDQADITDAVKGRFIDVSTRKLLKARNDVNYTELVNMYSAGDMRKSFTLRRIIKTAQKIKETKDKSKATAK